MQAQNQLAAPPRQATWVPLVGEYLGVLAWFVTIRAAVGCGAWESAPRALGRLRTFRSLTF